jgi:hypothetical protein
MKMSPNLAEWILSSVVQSEAAIMGLNLAALGIIAVFLYRDGEFHKYMDGTFSKSFSKFRNFIISSFTVGGFAMLTGLIGLIISESVSELLLVVFTITCSFLLLISVGLSISSGIIILNSIQAKAKVK